MSEVNDDFNSAHDLVILSVESLNKKGITIPDHVNHCGYVGCVGKVRFMIYSPSLQRNAPLCFEHTKIASQILQETQDARTALFYSKQREQRKAEAWAKRHKN